MNRAEILSHLKQMISDYHHFMIPSQVGDAKKIMKYDVECLEAALELIEAQSYETKENVS